MDEDNAVVTLEEAETTVIQGKTLLEWANTDRAKLESIYEHEFDPRKRALILTIFKHHILPKERKIY